MRKCQTCGYLVLGEGDVCKHCGAVLPAGVAAALVASGVAARAPAPAPPDPAPAPAPAWSFAPPVAPPPEVGRSSIARESWSPPTPPGSPARTRTTPRAVLVLVAVVSMAVGWIAVDHVFHDGRLPAGTSQFVAGHGVAYSSPDHTFDARFPAAPTLTQQPITIASRSAMLNLAQVQTGDYELVAASMVLPFSVPPSQVDTVLHEILNAGAAAQDAKILSEQHITRDGVPGIEVRARVRDGYDARFIALSSGSRLYMLGAHAKYGTGRLYDALVASLIMY